MPTITTSVSRACLRPAKTAERITVLLVMETLGGPRNIVLGGGPDPPTVRGRGVAECCAQYCI